MKSENTNNNNLRTIRKDKGLSLSEVSSKLKLTSDTIRKIENSEFKDLGAYTYVRGYLIHYTALLGVDSEQYLKLIPKSEFEVPLINTSSNLTKGIKLKRQSKNMASYMLGTFLVLVISFSGWYLLKNYSNFSKSNNNSIKIANQESLSLTPQIQNDNDSQNTSDNETKEEAFHYSSLIPANDENTFSEKSVNDNSDEEKSAEIVLDDIPVKTAEAALAYEVIIEARETSWVEVKKNDGSKLHNDLLKPGSVVLKSDSPLHFRIGNEKNVTVTINGETIDLSKYSRKNIADFNWPVES